jgi:hypothetical protein
MARSYSSKMGHPLTLPKAPASDSIGMTSR